MEKKRILIVDDEEDIVKIVTMRLKACGYEILSANNGLDGLTMAREQSPDLILLDVMMPKMDGYQVCRMLKFDEKYKHIPIIILSARGNQSDKDIGHETGADTYVIKPFDGGKLIEEIKKLL